MQAIVIRQFGGPEVLRLEEVPEPRTGAGEVLVRVHAAGVSTVDTETRAGRGVSDRLHGFPVRLGWSFSGVIESVGEGAARCRVGDHVYGMPSFPEPAGTCAEFVTADERSLAFKPRNLTHREAASMPLTALTAHQAFRQMDLQAGQTLLIQAVGASGDLAAQLARLRGAQVVRLPLHSDLTTDRFLDQDRLGPGLADALLDTVGGGSRMPSLALLKPGGRWLSTTDDRTASALERRPDLHVEHLQVQPSGTQLEHLTGLVERGLLRPPPSRPFPLEEAARAHGYSEQSGLREGVVLESRARSP